MHVIVLAGCQLVRKEGLVCGESGRGREESPGLSCAIAVRNCGNNRWTGTNSTKISPVATLKPLKANLIHCNWAKVPYYIVPLKNMTRDNVSSYIISETKLNIRSLCHCNHNFPVENQLKNIKQPIMNQTR